MPIEIRELVIRATVAPPGESDRSQPVAGARLNDEERRRLVEESVAQVLDVLRRRKER